MPKKKLKYAVFEGVEDASKFLKDAFAQARAIKDKYQKKLFVLELKASPEYKTALSCIGRKTAPSPYDHALADRELLIELAGPGFSETDFSNLGEFYRWNRRAGQP